MMAVSNERVNGRRHFEKGRRRSVQSQIGGRDPSTATELLLSRNSDFGQDNRLIAYLNTIRALPNQREEFAARFLFVAEHSQH